MEYGNVGGLPPISKLVLGSMVCSPDDQELTNDLLDAFVAAGGSCIDTAHIYGGGKSERAIGEWFAQRRNRDKIVLLDKGAHHDSSGPRVTPQCITADLTDSLERLQTDYIDLYLLHRDNPDVPVGPIVECLNELAAIGQNSGVWRQQLDAGTPAGGQRLCGQKQIKAVRGEQSAPQPRRSRRADVGRLCHSGRR